MKNLFFTIIALIGAYTSFAQCNPVLIDSPNGGTRNVFFMNRTVFTSSLSNTVSFYLDYGDGSGTNLCCYNSYVTHPYAGTGTSFTAILYMWRYDSTTTPATLLCSDTAQIQITFTTPPPPPTNKIYGTIYIDSLTIFPTQPIFKTWLIKFDTASNILSAVDSMIDTAVAYYGHYAFYNKPAGDYRVKTQIINIPAGSYGPIPTYGLDSLHWTGATVIHHTSGSDQQDIFMQNGTITSGPGFIGGNISSGANKGTGGNTPAANVSVLLYDKNGKVAASAITNANGDYTFSVPYGTYSIYPEVMNYKTTSWNNVVVSSTSASARGIDFKEHTTFKTVTPHTVGINSVASANSIAIFPNPSNGKINVSTAEAADVVVMDLVGHKNLTTKVNAGVTPLNLSTLADGLYIITVTSDNISYTTKVVLQH